MIHSYITSAVHPCLDCGTELWVRFDNGNGTVRVYDIDSEQLHVCPTPKRKARQKGTCSCSMTVYQRRDDGKIENPDGSPHEHIQVKGARGPIPALPKAHREPPSILGTYER